MDKDKNNADDLIGECFSSPAEIFGTLDKKITQKLKIKSKEQGEISARIEAVNEQNIFYKMQMQWINAGNR